MITKHSFHTGKGDGADSTFVKPSDWNAEHDLTVEGGAVWLGRDPSGPGEPQEFAVDYALPDDDFTMMTKAQVQAAIAAAVAAIPPSGVATGDLSASLAAVKTGWLLLNGQSIGNAGSAATYANLAAQPLFNLLWAINANTWPVLPARGADAAADWAALKTIAIPDARGCVIGMLDLAAGVNTLLIRLGTKYGEQDHTLTNAEIPPATGGIVNAGGVGTPVGQTSGLPGSALYSYTGDYLGHKHNIVQPTIGANIFIRL